MLKKRFHVGLFSRMLYQMWFEVFGRAKPLVLKAKHGRHSIFLLNKYGRRFESEDFLNQKAWTWRVSVSFGRQQMARRSWQ